MVGKLSKEQTKRHNRACELVDSDSELTETEREFVLDHFHESAHTGRTLDGAFFTPAELAGELHLVIPGNRIIDLCAGIGRLAWHARDLVTRHFEHLPPREIVCMEKNPEYVRVGRRILPEATWICADVLDVPGMNLGPFDCAISNPPFGRIKHSGNTPGYRGPLFEFHVIAVAQTLARRGAFIIPRESAPFRIEGGFVDQDSPAYERFHRETGITLRPNPGSPPTFSATSGATPHRPSKSSCTTATKTSWRPRPNRPPAPSSRRTSEPSGRGPLLPPRPRPYRTPGSGKTRTPCSEIA
ncbi:methyltransferase [Streptomyces olivaceoviridis]